MCSRRAIHSRGVSTLTHHSACHVHAGTPADSLVLLAPDSVGDAVLESQLLEGSNDAASRSTCCELCAAIVGCEAWTLNSAAQPEHQTMCELKGDTSGGVPPAATQSDGVVSGIMPPELACGANEAVVVVTTGPDDAPTGYAAECGSCPLCPVGEASNVECAATDNSLPTDMQCSECPVPSMCVGNNTCAPNAGSYLCSECDASYFYLLGKCRECGGSDALLPIILGCGAFLILVLLIQFGKVDERVEVTLRQVGTHAQLTNLYFGISIQWPEWAVKAARSIQGAFFDVGLFSPACVFGGGFYWVLGGTFAFMAVVLVVLKVSTYCSARRAARAPTQPAASGATTATARPSVAGAGPGPGPAAAAAGGTKPAPKPKTRTDMFKGPAKLNGLFASIVVLSYIPAVRTLMQTLDCFDTPRGLLLQVDPSIECTGGNHVVLMVFVRHCWAALGAVLALLRCGVLTRRLTWSDTHFAGTRHQLPLHGTSTLWRQVFLCVLGLCIVLPCWMVNKIYHDVTFLEQRTDSGAAVSSGIVAHISKPYAREYRFFEGVVLAHKAVCLWASIMFRSEVVRGILTALASVVHVVMVVPTNPMKRFDVSGIGDAFNALNSTAVLGECVVAICSLVSVFFDKNVRADADIINTVAIVASIGSGLPMLLGAYIAFAKRSKQQKQKEMEQLTLHILALRMQIETGAGDRGSEDSLKQLERDYAALYKDSDEGKRAEQARVRRIQRQIAADEKALNDRQEWTNTLLRKACEAITAANSAMNKAMGPMAGVNPDTVMIMGGPGAGTYVERQQKASAARAAKYKADKEVDPTALVARYRPAGASDEDWGVALGHARRTNGKFFPSRPLYSRPQAARTQYGGQEPTLEQRRYEARVAAQAAGATRVSVGANAAPVWTAAPRKFALSCAAIASFCQRKVFTWACFVVFVVFFMIGVPLLATLAPNSQ